MQSGGSGVAGNGRSLMPPQQPLGRSPSSSAASPTSSSSAASAQTHLGFEMIQQQQQQQLAYRQALQQQQQQLRRAEGENTLLNYQSGGTHGVIGGSNFPVSSSSIHISQPPRKFGDLSHQPGGPQLREENQNRGQVVGQQLQNPVHQAYIQFALQAAQQKSHGNMIVQQQMNMVGPSGRDQDILVNNLKVQEHMSIQGANQTQASQFKRSAEHFANAEKPIEQGHTSNDQRSDPKPPQVAMGQITSANMVRPVQPLQSEVSMQHIANNQLAVAQLQAMQTWAKEHNLDLSVPANVNLIAQVLPSLWQSARMAAMQKQNENSITMQQSFLPSSKQQVLSSPAGAENSAHGNSLSDQSGQAIPLKCRQTLPCGPISSGGDNTVVIPSGIEMQQQLAAHSRENQNERLVRPLMTIGSGEQVMHLQESVGMNQILEQSNAKNAFMGPETRQMQHLTPLQQLNRPFSQPTPATSEAVVTQIQSQGGSAQVPRQHFGFTKQQLHVLKAQILAFRRLKRGECTLPAEVRQSIVPLPLDLQTQQSFLSSGVVNQERTSVNNTVEARHVETNDNALEPAPFNKDHGLPKEELVSAEEKAAVASHMPGAAGSTKEPIQIGFNGRVEQNSPVIKLEQEVEKGIQITSAKRDCSTEKGKAILADSTMVDAVQVKKPASINSFSSILPPNRSKSVRTNPKRPIRSNSVVGWVSRMACGLL